MTGEAGWVTDDSLAWPRDAVAVQSWAAWEAGLPQTLRWADPARRLESARCVFIKPNLCAGTLHRGGSGVVTAPAVLARLIAAVKEVNPRARVVVGESDSRGLGLAYLKFENQGGAGWLGSGAEFVDLSRCRLEVLPFSGRYFGHPLTGPLALPEPLVSADYRISLAKLKLHPITVVSASVKNLLGCLPEPRKELYHPHLDLVLEDLWRAAPFDLAVVEGCPALCGPGPVDGHPVEFDVIVTAPDLVRADAVAAAILGVDARRVPHLRRLSAAAGTHLVPLPPRVGDRAGFRRPFPGAGPLARAVVRAGLGLQRLGLFVFRAGDALHATTHPGDLTRKLARLLGRGRGRRAGCWTLSRLLARAPQARPTGARNGNRAARNRGR